MKSMFAKRHYEAIASVMQDLRKTQEFGGASDAWHETRDELCRLFERDNDAFDRGRFERAPT